MSTLFGTPAIQPREASAIKPRPYQAEALAALDEHLATKTTNPCVVLPTGAGKSLVIAWAIQGWLHGYPSLRVMVLQHRKELVDQNAAEMHGLWPGGDIGVYAASLRKRDTDAAITFASIDSVYDKWGEFRAFDVIIVDEAHRIPARGEGKYRSFIAGCRSINKQLRVVGFTATPYRLGLGPVCHRDHVLNEIAYEANVGTLIGQGYLCALRSKVGVAVPDLSDVKRNKGGDYVETSLAKAVEVPGVVKSAVREVMAAVIAEKRKSIVFFCVDVKHCQAVSAELRSYGLFAPIVTASTPDHERDRIAEDFKQGRLQAICNVNVYTEGFNAQRVDCVALLRPTLSAGLYAQMVGRGLRLHPSKKDCLVLDFARCIETHGPIDALMAGEVRVIECGSVETKDVEEQPPSCGDTFSRALGQCPHCGWKIPPQEVAREEAEQKEKAEKKLHEAEASKRAILGSEPEEVKVDDVTLHRHRKPGMPDSVMVQYRYGLALAREWVLVDHPPDQGGRKARQWLTRRFGADVAKTITVSGLVDDLFFAKSLKEITETITVVRRGKHLEIVGHKLIGERANADRS